MLIWRLRQALFDAARASAWRVYSARKNASFAPPAFPTPRVLLPVANFARGIGLVILPIGVILFGAPLFILFMFVTLSLSPVLVPLAHLVYGAAITYNVSGLIARERENSTYDLLGTLPRGTLGLHWTRAVTWMTDHRGFRDAALVMVFIGIVAAVFGMAVIFNGTFDDGISPLAWFTSLICVLLLIVADHLGTQVTAALIAMIIPATTTSAVNARLSAVSLFAIAQIACYLVAAFTASALLPALFRLTGTDAAMIAYLLPIFTVFTFAACREVIVRQLWRAFRRAVNATPAELAELC